MFTLMLTRFGIKNILIAIAFTIAATFVGSLYVRFQSMKADLKTADATIEKLRSDVAAERVANEEQAAAVAVMKQQTIALQKRIQAAYVASAEAEKASNLEIARIRNAAVPKDCEGAVDWMKTEAVGISQRWNRK
jgi:hypothetical protein